MSPGKMLSRKDLAPRGWSKRMMTTFLPEPEGLLGGGLTGVCKNEIIATNRPRHTWIPAYPGMTEWA